MAVAFVQKTSGQTGTASTSGSATLPAAPTSGSLLVFQMGGDKNTGALTLSGFTQLYSLTSTSVSLYYWYKVSDGSETTINFSWATSSGSGNTYHYAEYDDSTISGNSWQVSAQASNITNETNVTSWSTGTTGAASAAGLAIAQMAMDTADSVVDGTTAWTNSFTARHTTLNSAGGRGATHIAEKAITASATAETTFSYTASTANRDQVSGAIAVWTKVSQDVSVASRGVAALHGQAATGYALTPHARGDAAAHGQAATVKSIRAGAFGPAAAHGAAQVTHRAVVAVSGHAAAHARVVLAAGVNDKNVVARGVAGVHAKVPITITTPPTVPAERTYVVPGESRTYVVPREEPDVSQPPVNRWNKDPNDRLRYRWDWGSAFLASGETITNSVVTTEPGITQVGTTSDATTVTVQLEGGAVGETYTISNKITTTDGNIVERDIHITVRER